MALLAAVPAFADPSITSKRAAGAAGRWASLQQLSDSLERARSQYDAANAQLAQIQRDLRENRRELRHREAQPARPSQRTIAQRLVALYTSDQESTLEVILGATQPRRHDHAHRQREVGHAAPTRRCSRRSSTSAARCAHSGQRPEARARRAGAASSRSARPRSTRSSRRSREEQRLYSSLKGEIEQLVAAQHARQLQLAREAQARLRAAAAAAQAQAQSHDDRRCHRPSTPEADTVVAPPPTHGGVVGVALVAARHAVRVGRRRRPAASTAPGLVMWAYAQVGVSLPHSSYAQYGYGVPVSRDQLAAGRPRLLRRARSRRHLHRRRPVRARAAHRRRRQDLEPRRGVVLGDVRRRPPHPLAAFRS